LPKKTGQDEVAVVYSESQVQFVLVVVVAGGGALQVDEEVAAFAVPAGNGFGAVVDCGMNMNVTPSLLVTNCLRSHGHAVVVDIESCDVEESCVEHYYSMVVVESDDVVVVVDNDD
jgi:hypothetical protein